MRASFDSGVHDAKCVVAHCIHAHLGMYFVMMDVHFQVLQWLECRRKSVFVACKVCTRTNVYRRGVARNGKHLPVCAPPPVVPFCSGCDLLYIW